MSGPHIQPVASRDVALEPYREGAPPSDWGGGGQEAAPEPKGPSLGRYLAAINRFKWLVLLITALGAAGGVFATRFITPEYEVQATILLEQGTGVSGISGGPIQAEQLLKSSGWQDLLRSFAIADPVVTVSAKQLFGNKVYVIGKVNKPGEYPINRPTDVMQGLAMAGGMTPFSAVNSIVILRRHADGQQEAFPFRYGDVEDGDDLDQNIVLQPGDVIVVP
jgi:hypothetical protein